MPLNNTQLHQSDRETCGCFMLAMARENSKQIREALPPDEAANNQMRARMKPAAPVMASAAVRLTVFSVAWLASAVRAREASAT